MVKLFYIVTDTVFVRVEATPELLATINGLVRWVVETEPRFKIVKTFSYGDKTISIPENIGELSYGQNAFLMKHIEKSKYLQENICLAAAVYLQPLLDGDKQNETRIRYWEKIFEELPVTEFFSVGFFLLKSVRESGAKRDNVWHQTKILTGLLRAKLQRTWRKLTGYRGLVINH